MQNTYPGYGLKRLKLLGLTLLCAGYMAASGQEYVYVKTDNLILRDRPEQEYEVLAILQPPCKLRLEKYEDGYKNNKEITIRFYQVAINYWDSRKVHHHIGGWVEKRYVVADKNTLAGPADDTALDLHASIVKVTLGGGSDKRNPNKLNWADFPPPRYKGGVNVPPPVKRVYRKGPKGGCYYVGPKGKKVYVNKQFCKGRD